MRKRSSFITMSRNGLWWCITLNKWMTLEEIENLPDKCYFLYSSHRYLRNILEASRNVNTYPDCRIIIEYRHNGRRMCKYTYGEA
jgi:hypothetical protein